MNIFEFVKSKVAILDVISEYVTLKPAGRYWKGPSPFQNERVPSFTVSPHKEIYYCFSSGQGGDVISFIAHIENCTQLEAAQHLIERYKLQVPKTIEWNKAALDINKKTTYEKTCEVFAQWCHANLKQSLPAQKYLQERAISKTIIDSFIIGYCPPSSEQRTQNLLELGYKSNLLLQDFIEAQLVVENRQGLYIPFEDRIIFPIYNHLGSCCGFGGRVFKSNDERAKYYNSHEHEFFNKGHVLFGLNRAKKSLQTQGHAFLVEGYVDCIAMVQSGYTNTIATLGTACTLDHLKQLSRYVHKLYVMYDGDAAGQKAMARLTDLCWQVNLELFVITLPANEDPASYLSKHTTLSTLINNAPDIFGFFIEHHGHHFASKPMQDQLTTVNHLLDTVAQLPDPLQKDLLLHRIAKAFSVPYETLQQQMNRKKKPVLAPTHVAEPSSHQQLLQSLPELEKKIFSAIINGDTPVEPDKEKFLLEHMSSPLAILLENYRNHSYQFNQFFNGLTESEKQLVSTITVTYPQEVVATLFKKLFLEFERQQLKTVVHALKVKLSQSNALTQQERMQLLLEFQKLKKDILHKSKGIL